jgi:hypothetical protein
LPGRLRLKEPRDLEHAPRAIVGGQIGRNGRKAAIAARRARAQEVPSSPRKPDDSQDTFPRTTEHPCPPPSTTSPPLARPSR